MGGLKRNPWLFGLGALLAVLVVFGGYARADVTTDQAGSIIIFPKVISDGTRDTVISISNIRNMPTVAHCIYNNSPSGVCSVTTTTSCRFDEDCPGTETCNLTTPGTCSTTSTLGCVADVQCPASETCVHQCVEHDFDIFLTGQQPTMWDVFFGRQQDPSDGFPGLDPGGIGGQSDFVGELICYVTDADGNPLMQNSLTGQATIYRFGGGPGADLSEYNGVTVFAKGTPAGNLDLNDTEYNACPDHLIVNHRADFDLDRFTSAGIISELTLVPCTLDFESQITPPARALFNVTNEFETPVGSASVSVGCFFNRQLSEIDAPTDPPASIFSLGTIGSDFAKTRVTTPTGKVCYTGTNRLGSCTSDSDCPGATTIGCRPFPGLIGVLEEFDISPLTPAPIRQPSIFDFVGTAAANVHQEGTRGAVGGDVIVTPSLNTSGQ